MTYDEAMTFISGTQVFGSRLGLEKIKYLLKLLDNPQDSLRFIHVAGTNGKGSFCAFINQILLAADYKVGFFTSPHIERFGERMMINGQEIPPEQVGMLGAIVKQKVDQMLAEGFESPTEFEIVAAMALVYFSREHCDVVVWEVGLGGRLDATNVIRQSELSVIMTLDFDHMGQLGNTLEEIAFEKGGIIKDGGNVISYPQQPAADAVLRRICAERRAQYTVADFGLIAPENPPEHSQTGRLVQHFRFGDLRLEIALLGEHQMKNAAVAITAAKSLARKGWHISDAAIREGLAKTRWPARFELIKKHPAIVLDGAHNLQGVRSLVGSLDQYFPQGDIVFVMGVLADKNYPAMIDLVLPRAACFFTVTPDSPRALSAADLAQELQRRGASATACGSAAEALEKASAAAGDGVLCCFGSLYFIGTARALLTQSINPPQGEQS